MSTLGHHVRIARAAGEAFAILGEWKTEVVLSDLGLPDVDGYAFARMVRERGYQTRLVAVSGYGNASDRARAQDAGFDQHITKPVDAATLVQLLGDAKPA